MKIIFRILKIIGITGLVFILLFNLYSLYQRRMNHNPFPMVFGYGYAVIASGSMEPELSWGDLIIIQQQEDYQENDIVTFIQPGDSRPTTHRITAVNKDVFLTRGDANNTEDPPISLDQVYGRVIFTIPLIGYLLRFIETPLGVLCFIGIFLMMHYFDTKDQKKEEADRCSEDSN